MRSSPSLLALVRCRLKRLAKIMKVRKSSAPFPHSFELDPLNVEASGLHTNAANLLVQEGIDINQGDYMGRTPLLFGMK
ncbi:hypothetical protein BSK56_22640 [Paenibacillus borealis]|uniref:Ankyrin n=1 Tax=Paenibacillus borealis TaxID=160799 RepID=A0ABX3H269_PAEBO|nr:hypothetical protein BSK56_22640 [Paenibacillus borealis]